MITTTLIVDSDVNQCKVDTRVELIRNLVLIGGASELRGFKARLLRELKHLCTNNPRYAPLKGNCLLCWISSIRVKTNRCIRTGKRLWPSINVTFRTASELDWRFGDWISRDRTATSDATSVHREKGNTLILPNTSYSTRFWSSLLSLNIVVWSSSRLDQARSTSAFSASSSFSSLNRELAFTLVVEMMNNSNNNQKPPFYVSFRVWLISVHSFPS